MKSVEPFPEPPLEVTPGAKQRDLRYAQSKFPLNADENPFDQLRNRHAGENCLYVGNGPSLNKMVRTTECCRRVSRWCVAPLCLRCHASLPCFVFLCRTSRLCTTLTLSWVRTKSSWARRGLGGSQVTTPQLMQRSVRRSVRFAARGVWMIFAASAWLVLFANTREWRWPGPFTCR